ncbi:protein PLANT CADMIUM RESISTANCE 6-like [Coffea eugenioides]|uniref:protein PLANT CADMIUM RESISTANCE 6-like n=1 Tax=Coffea eugenioides TaxID=49369 RepID=UPI000F60F0CD|nr:protein PLANT CADMIUM RESISTANCE 6-like [Coffea eugenioides]
MGRPDANSGPSQRGGQHQQPQEYHFQPATQSPETIDDAPPPFETSNDEIHQENYEHEQPQKEEIAGQQNQHAQSHPTPSRGPMAFPPQNTQMRSSPTGHQPQAFPPPQGKPQAFPPSQDHQPEAFPPSQGHQLQAFPPPQDHQPQAFPPVQGHQPQAFPPSQGHQPQAFPPSQGQQPQAFPPPQGQPQAFPPQQSAFQQPNMAQFAQAATFSQPAMGVGGQVPIHQAMPNSPLVHPHAQVINNTPMTGFPVAQVLPTQPWNTALFACMDDPTNALITACFPCVTFGQIAEIVDSGQTSCGTSGMLYGLIACFIAMPCLLSCTYRTKLRNRYGLMEAPAPDWMIHCFCEWCALCQEYRELKERNLDPSIGWLGNVAKSQQMAQLAAMTPPAKQTMMG